jgi:hypothetical protein
MFQFGMIGVRKHTFRDYTWVVTLRNEFPGFSYEVEVINGYVNEVCVLIADE